MLRRALPSLFCALALSAPAYGQDVFVPRELKALAVHPQKTKEVVRPAESATEADVKAPAKDSAANADASKPKASKTETAPVKTEKAVVKEKPAPPNRPSDTFRGPRTWTSTRSKAFPRNGSASCSP